MICKAGQDAGERGHHLSACVAISIGLAALEPREYCRRHIELDGDLVVWQRRRDFVDLTLKRLVIDWIERLMQIVLQEQPKHRVRRHQIEMEAALLRHNAFP